MSRADEYRRFPTGPAQCPGVTLTIRNDYSELTRVASWLAEAADKFELTGNLIFRLDLVLNEALPNIISYAYPDDGCHYIAIALRNDADRAVLEITDDGTPFNPFEHEPFSEAGSLADATIGGRGIHLIRSVTDEQHYERRENCNLTRLTLYKTKPAERRATTVSG